MSADQNALTVERILEAEMSSQPPTTASTAQGEEPREVVNDIMEAASAQISSLTQWAKLLVGFCRPTLPLSDQVRLISSGWNEILLASLSHRSMHVENMIILANGVQIHRNNAQQSGVGPVFDRILTELVAQMMREMAVNQTELACLKAIVLFNPGVKNLKNVSRVESLRENASSLLEEYCKSTYPKKPGRFAKLLLRLPALRSIGLKCMEHLFFFKMISDTPIESFLTEMLDQDFRATTTS